MPRLACSVANLGLYPGHQLLECYSLHCKTLTGYLLGKEPPSAYTATHNMQHCISAPKVTAEPHVECLRAVGLLIKTAACVDWQGMAPSCMDATPFARTQTLSARTQPPGPPPSSTTERVFSLTPLCTDACWAEARIKITRMTLTIKLDRNWSSFQLANSAPPLSVTDSATAPSARIVHCRSPKQHLSEILRCHILLLGGAHATAICCLSCLYSIYQAVA